MLLGGQELGASSRMRLSGGGMIERMCPLANPPRPGHRPLPPSSTPTVLPATVRPALGSWSPVGGRNQPAARRLPWQSDIPSGACRDDLARASPDISAACTEIPSHAELDC